MNIFKIAALSLRNLFRNRRRTLITVLVSASGFTALAIVAGYMEFTFFGLKETTICFGFTAQGGTGHLQIFNSNSLENEELYPMQYGIKNYDQLQNSIESMPDVSFTIPRIEFTGLVSNGDKSLSFIGHGINPQKEAMLLHYWNSLHQISEGAKVNDSLYTILQKKYQNGVLLGKEMAKSLHATPGSDLLLMSTTVDGAVNVIDITVAGIVDTGLETANKYYLETKIQTVQDLLFTDKISNIAVVINNTDKTHYFESILDSTINKKSLQTSFTVIPWEKLASYYNSIRDIYTIIFGFVGFIVVSIVFLSCTNTMLMATMERISEIGTLKAIGVSNKWLSLLFLLEGFFIGLISIIIGISFKYIFSFIINISGYRMPPPPGMSSSYLLKIFPASEQLPWISLLIIVSTTFSGLFTLLKIKKMSIVESLSHV